MLRKWKQSKELKKKLSDELKKSKPAFKCSTVCHAQPKFLVSQKSPHAAKWKNQPTALSQQSPAREVESMQRMTRSRARLAHPNDMPVQSSDFKKPVKATKTNSVQISRGRKKEKSPHKDVRRSFAPENFVFIAPHGISSYDLGANDGANEVLNSTCMESPRKNPEIGSQSSSHLQGISCDIVQGLENMKVQSTPKHTEESDYMVGDSLAPNTCDEEIILVPSSPVGTNSHRKQVDMSPLLEINPNITTTRGSRSLRKSQKTQITANLDEVATNLELELGSHDERESAAAINPIRTSTGVLLSVQYFRDLLDSYTLQLKSLCQHWKTTKDDVDLTEEVDGIIMTVVGQSELLMNERFGQFAGLINDCEQGTGERLITLLDLQGFWEMIFYQVEDVLKKFSKLEQMQQNNWITTEDVIPPKKNRKGPTKNAGSKKVVEAGAIKHTQAARNRLAEIKGKMANLKCNMNEGENGFFITNTPKNTTCRLSHRIKEPLMCVTSFYEPSHELTAVSENELSEPRSARRQSLRRSVLNKNLIESANVNCSQIPVEELHAGSADGLNRSRPSLRLSELFSPLKRKTMNPTIVSPQLEPQAMKLKRAKDLISFMDLNDKMDEDEYVEHNLDGSFLQCLAPSEITILDQEITTDKEARKGGRGNKRTRKSMQSIGSVDANCTVEETGIKKCRSTRVTRQSVLSQSNAIDL